MQRPCEAAPRPGGKRAAAPIKYSRGMGISTRKILRFGLTAAALVQLSAVGVVYAIDRVRKARQVGGPQGFPKQPPRDVPVENSEVRIYTDGESLYEDMLESIDQAREQICFETYVWRSDATGRKFKEALERAAHRGVDVHAVYDGFGSFKSAPWFKVFAQNPHLFVRRFPEIRSGLFLANLRRTGREHRKLLICDQKVAYVGGYNVGDDFGSQWRDTHVRILGEGVCELYDGFVDFWNQFKRRKHPALERTRAKTWNAAIECAFNMPSRLLYPVRGLYLDTFQRAQSHLYITTAYFVPDREILAELVAAAKRGVRVKVLIPEYSNHILADWVARPFYGKLLEARVEIWLFQHAMIHAKTLTADGRRSIVGTANIDRLSMQGNYEVNVQIDSPEFASAMEEVFATDLQVARRLTYSEWLGRGRFTRLLEFAVQAFYPVV